MTHLKCKDHDMRVQVSTFGQAPSLFARVLHRTGKTRCDSTELLYNREAVLPALVNFGQKPLMNGVTSWRTSK